LNIPNSTDLASSFDLTSKGLNTSTNQSNPNNMRLLNPMSLSVAIASIAGETSASNPNADLDDLALGQQQTVNPP
jgi:hypothetical protein